MQQQQQQLINALTAASNGGAAAAALADAGVLQQALVKAKADHSAAAEQAAINGREVEFARNIYKTAFGPSSSNFCALAGAADGRLTFLGKVLRHTLSSQQLFAFDVRVPAQVLSNLQDYVKVAKLVYSNPTVHSPPKLGHNLSAIPENSHELVSGATLGKPGAIQGAMAKLASAINLSQDIQESGASAAASMTLDQLSIAFSFAAIMSRNMASELYSVVNSIAQNHAQYDEVLSLYNFFMTVSVNYDWLMHFTSLVEAANVPQAEKQACKADILMRLTQEQMRVTGVPAGQPLTTHIFNPHYTGAIALSHNAGLRERIKQFGDALERHSVVARVNDMALTRERDLPPLSKGFKRSVEASTTSSSAPSSERVMPELINRDLKKTPLLQLKEIRKSKAFQNKHFRLCDSVKSNTACNFGDKCKFWHLCFACVKDESVSDEDCLKRRHCDHPSHA